MNALDAGYALAAVITAPFWAAKTRGDWPARFGRIAPLPPARDGRRRILVHAVSVGEVNAVRGLVPALARAGADVVLSVGTDTGIARARALFAPPLPPTPAAPPAPPLHHVEPNHAAPTGESLAHADAPNVTVVRYPVDFSRCVRRFLDAVRPDAVGLVELEIWPNFVGECARRGIPVCVVNGRLSERSFRGYRRGRWFIGRSFRSLAHAAVQDEEYRGRFVAMGVDPARCTVTGSMKWDAAAIADEVPGAERLAAELGIDRTRPLIVAGSTGPLADGGSEESLVHRACPPGVQLLCAPRQPSRVGEARSAMPGCTVRRTGEGGTPVTEKGEPGTARFVLATIGELRAAYSLADVVVVGRSFGALYGSDPIEPISLGRATVIGPAVKDFASVVDLFERHGGIVRTGADGLARVLKDLLADPARRAELVRRGRGCILANRGATARHAELLLGLAVRAAN